MSLFISIDPGNNKCGLLLADRKSGIVIDEGFNNLNTFYGLFNYGKKNISDRGW